LLGSVDTMAAGLTLGEVQTSDGPSPRSSAQLRTREVRVAPAFRPWSSRLLPHLPPSPALARVKAPDPSGGVVGAGQGRNQERDGSIAPNSTAYFGDWASQRQGRRVSFTLGDTTQAAESAWRLHNQPKGMHLCERITIRVFNGTALFDKILWTPRPAPCGWWIANARTSRMLDRLWLYRVL
jgi:hypothetical protein